MDLHLTNKLALITGSTKGIGKAIAIEMAREGTDVIINGRNEAEVTKVVKEITNNVSRHSSSSRNCRYFH